MINCLKKYIDILFLQISVIIYTLSGIFAKLASQSEILSKKFIFFYLLEFIILGIYAIIWQQILKKFEVSIAYANKSLSLIWSLVWASIFFKETITIQNIIGTLVVLVGIMVVNIDE